MVGRSWVRHVRSRRGEVWQSRSGAVWHVRVRSGMLCFGLAVPAWCVWARFCRAVSGEVGHGLVRLGMTGPLRSGEEQQGWVCRSSARSGLAWSGRARQSQYGVLRLVGFWSGMFWSGRAWFGKAVAVRCVHARCVRSWPVPAGPLGFGQVRLVRVRRCAAL
jgi:hypothetical protein